MTLKSFIKDLKDFSVYILTEPFLNLGLFIKDFWKTLVNKRTMMYLWAILFVIFSFINNKNMMIFSMLLYFTFFILFHWSAGEFRARARQRWKKKIGKKD